MGGGGGGGGDVVADDAASGGIRKGGGFGWDTPPPRVPLWSPLRAGQKCFSLNPLGTEGAEAKSWLSASNSGRGRGGGGGWHKASVSEEEGGGGGGGGLPPLTHWGRVGEAGVCHR